MKKLYLRLIVLLSVIMILTFSGCSQDPQEDAKDISTAIVNTVQYFYEALSQKTAEQPQSSQSAIGTGVWNILLIGSDRRDASWNGNSDSMILVSVNPASAKIHMISFMRDTHAEIPGYGGRKLNAAYALGGAALLEQTIESNFQINIDNYASVDFDKMAQIIDRLGGVDIELNQSEANYLNQSGYSTAAGMTHMDGSLALAYSRIRYVGNCDFERTQRQRRVLEQVFNKFKAMDFVTKTTTIASVLPLISTDCSAERITWLVGNVAGLLSYSLEPDRIPYDGLYGYSGEELVCDMPSTIARLQATLAQ